MSLEFTIICDHCGIVGDSSGRSAAVARRELREIGWDVAPQGGRGDYCTDRACREKSPRYRPARGLAVGEEDPDG